MTHAKQKKKGTIVLIVIGLLLIAAALCFVIYNVAESNEAEEYSEEILAELENEIPQDDTQAFLDGETVTGTESIPGNEDVPEYVSIPGKEMPVISYKGNDYIGYLTIPALDLKLPVMSDWDYTRLRRAPCRYYGSVYLNNMVIAAHNYRSHFRYIGNLSIGDEVYFTDAEGNFFPFEVYEVETLNPTAVEEMINSGADLTLFTCTLGGRTRVTVRCNSLTK